jgi:hypothetical protein
LNLLDPIFVEVEVAELRKSFQVLNGFDMVVRNGEVVEKFELGEVLYPANAVLV